MGIYPPPKLGHLRRRDVRLGSKPEKLAASTRFPLFPPKADIRADMPRGRLGAISGHEGGGSVLAKDLTEAGRLLYGLLIRFGAVSADPETSRPRIQRYTKTGIFVCVRTLFVTLPSTTADSPPRPCDAMAMRSQPLSEAAATMA
jgi:hypothetical protein